MTLSSRSAFLKKVLKDNRFYFIAFLVFLAFGLVILSNLTQGQDILFFNQRRTPLGDWFFRYGTQMGEEIAYLGVIAIFLFYSYRNAFMIPIVGLMVSVTSAITKEIFSHPRPFLWFTENGMEGLIQTIEGVAINMGTNSFPSGHTMSAFALFTFVALCVPYKRIAAILIFLIPLMVGISRIYLIKHFLEDVLLGATIGVMLAVLAFMLQYRIFKYPHTWLDNGLTIRLRTTVEKAMDEVTPVIDEEKEMQKEQEQA